MGALLAQADRLQAEARAVIDDSAVIASWRSIGARINLVGSLKTGLMIGNRDIDFHIYTDPFNLADSFLAISRLAQNPRVKRVSYSNLLAAEDRCIEWHAWYEDRQGREWQIDMIHILNDSPYAGYFERVAERIAEVLTPATRGAILRIKNDLSGMAGDNAQDAGVAQSQSQSKVPSILVYRAVIEDGVRSLEAFKRWLASRADAGENGGIVNWMP